MCTDDISGCSTGSDSGEYVLSQGREHTCQPQLDYKYDDSSMQVGFTDTDSSVSIVHTSNNINSIREDSSNCTLETTMERTLHIHGPKRAKTNGCVENSSPCELEHVMCNTNNNGNIDSDQNFDSTQADCMKDIVDTVTDTAVNSTPVLSRYV